MRKRNILKNMKSSKYLSLFDYFETPPGKELMEYLKSEKPIVLIFMTRGGYVIETQIARFTGQNGSKKEEIMDLPQPKEEPPIPRPPDPLNGIMAELEEPDPDPDTIELKVGDEVKYQKDGIASTGRVMRFVGEDSVEIQDILGEFKVIRGESLISIVK